MNNERTVLFDLGGTLIYFDGDWSDVFLRADHALMDSLAKDGIQLDREAFREDFRTRLNAYYAERETAFTEYTTTYVLKEALVGWGYLGVPNSTIKPALAAMYSVSQAHWLPEEDAIATLTALRDQGCQLGIISNAGDDADVQVLVDKAKVRPYFDLIITSAALGIRKPNPRIFDIAMQRMEAKPEQTVMVGDTLGADVLGASNASISSIWITRRADTPANRAHTGTIVPDAAVETLAEIPAMIELLLGSKDQQTQRARTPRATSGAVESRALVAMRPTQASSAHGIAISGWRALPEPRLGTWNPALSWHRGQLVPAPDGADPPPRP